MLYKQHKFVGDSVYVGKNVTLPGQFKGKGRILFSQKEKIQNTSWVFIKELMKYNNALKGKSLDVLRYKAEMSRLVANVRRTFGDVNGWAGDHSKLDPPDGKAKKFKDLKVKLQSIANTVDIKYGYLALKNWEHFMPMSYTIWKTFHLSALRLAKKYAESENAGPAYKQDVALDRKTKALVFDLDNTDLAKALFIEGYACHFLEDCFVSGHIRTPRLLFGSDLDSIKSKEMHDDDNKHGMFGCAKNDVPFRLIGEDKDKHNFSDTTKLKNDPDMKLLFDKVVEAVSKSVQQVFDSAYIPGYQKEKQLKEIEGKIPQVEIYWRTLTGERSRTHSLEIWPKSVDKNDIHPPLYKFHANYDNNKKKFKDPLIFKRSESNKWRLEMASEDVDYFTPGVKPAEWIPADPAKKKSYP